MTTFPTDIRASLKCAGLVITLLVGLTGLTLATNELAKEYLLLGYGPEYKFVPGHHFGARLSQVLASDGETCLILGVSTEREGFDADILEVEVPHLNVVNLATTGGNNEVLELQATVLHRFGLRPRCIIAGFSLWMMFDQGSPSLTKDEYFGLLGWRDIVRFGARSVQQASGAVERARILMRHAIYSFLPLRSHATQFNRVTRATVWEAHVALGGDLGIRQFENYEGELRPVQEFFYLGLPSPLETERDQLIKHLAPWRDPGRYGNPQQAESFRRTLDLLSGLTDVLVLVNAPRTELLGIPSSLGRSYVLEILNENADRIVVVDCPGIRDEKYFHDQGHLNEVGRSLLSRQTGALMRTILQMEGGSSATSACEIVERENIPLIQ